MGNHTSASVAVLVNALCVGGKHVGRMTDLLECLEKKIDDVRVKVKFALEQAMKA